MPDYLAGPAVSHQRGFAVRAADWGRDPDQRRPSLSMGMMMEYQARFIVTSLHMLAQWSQQKSPITGIQVPGGPASGNRNLLGFLTPIPATDG
jgi:hypothetical protein